MSSRPVYSKDCSVEFDEEIREAFLVIMLVYSKLLRRKSKHEINRDSERIFLSIASILEEAMKNGRVKGKSMNELMRFAEKLAENDKLTR